MQPLAAKCSRNCIPNGAVRITGRSKCEFCRICESRKVPAVDANGCGDILNRSAAGRSENFDRDRNRLLKESFETGIIGILTEFLPILCILRICENTVYRNKSIVFRSCHKQVLARDN